MNSRAEALNPNSAPSRDSNFAGHTTSHDLPIWKSAIGSLAPARSARRALPSLCSGNPFRGFPSRSSQQVWKPALRLAVGRAAIQVLTAASISIAGLIEPAARADTATNPNSQAIEGTVEFIQPMESGRLDLKLISGTNRMDVTVEHPNGNCPTQFSRIRVNVASGGSSAVTVSNLDQIQFLTGLQRPLATSVAELCRLGTEGQHIACVAHLEGQVLAASPGRGTFAIKDSTGVALLEMKTRERDEFVSPGQVVILEGNAVVEGDCVVLRDFPVVDNNDTHSMNEESGGIFLTAGRHPFELSWFNWLLPYGLEVYYEGPGLPRQRVPDAVLFHTKTGPASGSARLVPGVDYRCYEGYWLRVPDFDRLIPVKEGAVSNFDLSVISRDVNVGLQFSGCIEVPRAGIYTFSTKSDDGSLLYVDEKPPSVEVTGTNALPAPIVMGQSPGANDDDVWAQTEGTVTFAAAENGMLELGLASEAGQIHVEVADDTGASAHDLLKRRVRATGISLSTYTSEGQSVAGKLLVPGMEQVQMLDEPEAANRQGTSSNSGQASGAVTLPVLTTVEQIKELNRHEWDRGYPVKLRGVITAVLDSGFFIHDSSGSIYARWHPPTDPAVPRVGDFWEIEGTTFAEFAPNIHVQSATWIGRGTLPEPVRPTWDQLINGSLDTDYVEVPGIVTAIDDGGVTLLTRTGKISIQLPDVDPALLGRYENALVRVRGCVVPARNIRTQQVELGQIDMINATIDVDEPAPANPFSAPLEHASDLLMFDPRAGALQRVKIAGQIVHGGPGEYFMMDGHDGLRFFPKTNVMLTAGDLVQVVGFPELGGPSPFLREAVVRKIGSAPLPLPMPVPPDSLFSRRYDSTLVQVRARLTGIVRTLSEQALELQIGTRGFVARLRTSDGLLPELSPGSLLELTGVYDGQGGDLASGREIDSFDILLNSSSDITVLARPSWWTLRHMLTIVGIMAVAIVGALIWIRLLHKRVEERSAQLAAEVRRREQTERQRELERERTRIARDLHDDLGATLTQIRFLSAVESRDSQVPEGARARMSQISEKSHEMVASLDEIVWAVNPVNDSMPHLASYLCHFAEEFFRPTPIRCRLDVDDSLPQATFTSELRHNLYLAVREAMNNISKHSKASEAWLRIRFEKSELRITVEDNGCGFTLGAGSSGEGLVNMRQRLEKVGGRFEIRTQPGGGTICEFRLPLEVDGRSGLIPIG
ncbi:MAG TPA: ATP-binding protein [Verrucomicrobiae bacterium]|nr:ATP-binding protein [Verrucomicrobiae bacterium]